MHQAGLTWEWKNRMRERGGTPVILKGAQTSEDVEIAIERGVDAIDVSNHGGRQRDYGDGTIEILREVTAVVGNRAEIAVDGGFLRGTDALKALALRANAVALDRSRRRLFQESPRRRPRARTLGIPLSPRRNPRPR